MKTYTLEQAKALRNEASALWDVIYDKRLKSETNEQAVKTQRILNKAEARYNRRVELQANIKWPNRKASK